MLDAGGLDAVVVVTPNMTHVDILADVLAVPDLHVLVEKPLCTTVEDCERVIDIAEGRPGIVWVGLEYRYMPPVARLIDEVRAGAVGTPHMVAIREHRFPFLVKVGDWNRFNANTGGTLVEKCCHFFDLMNLLADADPVRVYASGGQSVNHLDENYDGRTPDILDNAFVVVDYANGVRALLDLCMFAEATHNQEEISVVGDAGKVEALIPESVFRRRPPGRALDRRRGVGGDPRRLDRLRGPPPRLELRRARPILRRHPQRHPTRGDPARRPAVGGARRRRAPQHRRGAARSACEGPPAADHRPMPCSRVSLHVVLDGATSGLSTGRLRCSAIPAPS